MLNRYAKLIPSMMLNKPRIKTWAQPNLMCEPTRIELRQDLINSAMTPMFKATALEVRNDEKIQTFQPNSTGFNPITPFRPKTQRGIGLFQQRIEQQAQMSTSTNQFSSINKSKIDSVSTNSMISSLLSTPVIIRKKPSYRGPTITEDENRPCQTPQSILKVKKLIQTDEKKGVPNSSSKSKEENIGEDFQSQKESARSESRMSRESTPGKSLRFDFCSFIFDRDFTSWC